MCFLLLLVLLFTSALSSGTARAQTPQAQAPATPATKPGAITIDEATALTQGWAWLAEGHVARAASRAADVLAIYPRSPGALVLAVEAEIARSGSRAGLEQYERWLGSRAFEEPSVVRRIAIALLRETVSGSQMDAARLEAIRALAADGDRSALAELSSASKAGSAPETRVLAAMGDERAVNALIAQLNTGAGNILGLIGALADSGSNAAIDPLAERLQHATPEIRAAAVEALGKLGTRYDVVDRVKPLLDDRSSFVRIRAAAALFKLGDVSGLTLLRGLLQEEAAVSRLIAVQAMASQPDALWLDSARRLTSAAEPDVRLGAARVLAPHDPELARQVLDRGMNDENPAIREIASEALGDVAGGDLRMVRHFLKLPDRLGRVRAAARVLVLVR